MSSTIVIRAELSDAEWVAIQKQALDLRCRPSQLIGKTLRSALLAPKEKTA